MATSSGTQLGPAAAPWLVERKSQKSRVWKYFALKADDEGLIIDPQKPVCERRLRTLQTKDRHPDLYKQFKVSDFQFIMLIQEPQSSQKRHKQPTISEAFERHRKYDKNSHEARKLDRAVAEFICMDQVPVYTVEKHGFQQMLEQFNPRYQLPSRNYFMYTEIPKIYTETRDLITQNLKEKPFCKCQIHRVPRKQVLELGLLGGGCGMKFDRGSRLPILYAGKTLEDHTGQNIAHGLKEVMAAWGLQEDKLICITMDNASNMKKKHGWASVRCTGHTLQLIVNSALKDPSISRAVGAARSLVEHFRGSKLANTKLKLKQQQMNTAQHKLIQDVSTRWNSTYYMVERLLEQHWPVTATLSDPEVTPRGNHHFDWKPDQWVLLEELMKGLQPFECATVYLNNESLSEEEEETQADQKIQMVRNEVQMYFAEPAISKKEDPLIWWRENEGRYPTLSKLARSLLCIPATSTPSERIFSAAGNICSQKRASLTRDHVEMLTFLSLNKLRQAERERERERESGIPGLL
uniref:HAT C-terminal dimerisation domain-containing protein n=1 Tax=Seriola dumerili TaxID=41447 RepID=A0A3B4T2Q5_SERDU